MAGAGALLGALGRRSGAPAAPRWRFSLDDTFRWSLAGDRAPLIDGAAVAVELWGTPPVLLGDLEGVRRLRTGDRRGGVWTVVGRAGTVEVTAQFGDGPPPAITMRVRGLDEPRDLAALHFSEGAAAPGRLVWLNGYGSDSPCAIVPTGQASGRTGHWQIAFLGGAELAMQFGGADGAAGVFSLEGGLLRASCRFPRRTLGAERGPVACTLTIVPGRDALEALGRLDAGAVGPAGNDDPAPAGWRTRRALGALTREEDVLAQLEVLGRELSPAVFRLVQLDRGYQRGLGDWDMGAGFPHGHRWLTDRVHAMGLQAALWIAPFHAAEDSPVAVEHPGWLLTGEGGRPLAVDTGAGPAPAFILDGSQRPVQDWMRALARRAVGEWGYDQLTLALPPEAARDLFAERGASSYEALRAGLRALREGAARAFVAAEGAPLQHLLGLVDQVRVCPGVTDAWRDIVLAARGVLLRAHLGRRAWLNDPDAVLLGPPLTADEARTWASVCALAGGPIMVDDALTSLPPDRFDILRRVLPAVPVRGRPADLTSESVTLGRVPSWIVAQVRGDWWTLAAVNWDDQPTRLEADLSDLGLRGPLAVWDAWNQARLPDVRGHLALDLPTHGAMVLGLRRPKAAPFVVGTSRHLVQGALDLEAEHWDSRRRVLSGRSSRLDGRPYAITIGVPPGFHPRRCGGDAACEVSHPHQGDGRTVRLEFAAPPSEIAWEVGF